ncbi:restriction endonuclease subunit S [Metabacillus sp. FJAT-53654]|uniref:Restriction endonuclease subunit S n=1 Tax=Metabacillus rhizosphaerae TaxID=3117747 RepID=A0ABZ2MP03_9BACI
MSKKKVHTLNELLEKVLVPEDEQPYDIPENWVYVRLGKVVEFQGGSQPPKSVFKDEQLDGYIRLIQIRDFKSDKFKTYIPKELAKRTFEENDVMIGRYGPPVFQILRGLSGAYNVALMKATPIKCLMDNDYLYYLLQVPFIQNPVIKESHRTAGQTGIRKELIEDFVIGLPPMKEQKRISEKIKRFLSKIEEAKQLIEEAKETFELRRAAILDKAFRGVLGTNDSKEESVIKVLGTDKINNDVNEPFEIPENWVWTKLEDISEYIQRGKSPKYVELSNVKVVSQKCVQWSGFDINPARFIDEETIKNYTKERLLRKNDILWNSTGTGTIGRVAIINELEGIVVADSHVTIVRSDNIMNSRLLFRWLSGPYIQNKLKNAWSGSTNQVELNLTTVKQQLVPLPPLNEQERIVEKVDYVLSKLEEEQKLTQTTFDNLEAMRESILSKAFRGELGTNDPSEENAIELLKEVLEEQLK